MYHGLGCYRRYRTCKLRTVGLFGASQIGSLGGLSWMPGAGGPEPSFDITSAAEAGLR